MQNTPRKKNFSSAAKGPRAQASFELISVVAIMFIILLSLFTIYFSYDATARDYRETLELRSIAQTLARHMDAVAIGGNGTNSTAYVVTVLTSGKTPCIVISPQGRVEAYLQSSGINTKAESAPLVTRNIDTTDLCIGGSGSYWSFINVNGRVTLSSVSSP